MSVTTVVESAALDERKRLTAKMQEELDRNAKHIRQYMLTRVDECSQEFLLKAVMFIELYTTMRAIEKGATEHV